jgi:hypothetical protein
VPVVAQEAANNPKPTTNTAQANRFANQAFIVRFSEVESQ